MMLMVEGLPESSSPLIACFDIASTTGICWGVPGGKPHVASWSLWKAGERPARLSQFWDLLNEFFQDERPDIVRYEAPMNLAGMGKAGSSEETILLLRGAVGVFELAAYRAGIKDMGSYTVFQARKHLTGQARWKAKHGKAEVMRVAKMLGVKVEDTDQADAFAGWSFVCGLYNPRIAHLNTPLFGRAQPEL